MVEPTTMMALASLALQGARAGGLFGKPRMQGLTTDQKFGNYSRRRQEIGDFANTLKNARASYANAYSNFQTNALNRFSGGLETKFGPRGLNVQGGAYQAALAREAAKYQDIFNVNMANREHEDLMYIDKAYAGNDAALQNIPLQGNGGDPGGDFINGLSGLGMQMALTPGMNDKMKGLFGSGKNPASMPVFGGDYSGQSQLNNIVNNPFGRRSFKGKLDL